MVDSAGRSYDIARGIPRLVRKGSLGGEDARWNRFYELLAPLYEVNERVFVWVLTGLNVRAEQQRMVASLGISPGSSLLEICTGPGVFQPWLAQAVGPDGKLVALDLSMNMLYRCYRRTRNQLPVPLVVQGNGNQLPFADASFDYLFHFGAIKLFTSPDDALKECARVLRPGGRLFLGDEGYEPTISKRGLRRRIMMRINPGFRKPPPSVPPELRVLEQKEVYDGLGFLWTLERDAV